MIFLIIANLLLASACYADNSLDQVIDKRVQMIIEKADALPDMKSQLFQVIHGDLHLYWNQLQKAGMVKVKGADQNFRPAFVGLQAIVEHVMAHALNREIQSLVGIIHTPAPCTPLCNREIAANQKIDETLVAPDIKKDPKRLYTVQARTKTIRDFYRLGGTLYIAFPKEGRSLRTAEQLAIYDKELQKYPDHLIERVLNIQTFPPLLSALPI